MDINVNVKLEVTGKVLEDALELLNTFLGKEEKQSTIVYSVNTTEEAVPAKENLETDLKEVNQETQAEQATTKAKRKKKQEEITIPETTTPEAILETTGKPIEVTPETLDSFKQHVQNIYQELCFRKLEVLKTANKTDEEISKAMALFKETTPKKILQANGGISISRSDATQITTNLAKINSTLDAIAKEVEVA